MGLALVRARQTRAKIYLDKSLGLVKYLPSGWQPANIGTPDANHKPSFSEPQRLSQGRYQQPKNNNNTMQNYCKTIGALAAASALVAGNASAEVEYEIHTGYSTDYIFRGLDFGTDLIEVGIAASTEVSGFGVSAGAWYATWDNAPGDFEELDLFAEVSKDLGFATAAIGYIYYHFPNAVGASGFDSQEVYFSASKELFGVDTSLTYFWEIEDADSGFDGYLELGASKGIELSSCLTLNTGATLGYLVEESDLAHLTTKVSLDWAFTETATLSPYIAHSWALSDTPTSFYEGSENQFYGGLSVAVSF